MARVDFKCSCGHAFFVSDTKVVNGAVECPACAEPVRRVAPRTSAAAVAARPGTRRVSFPTTQEEAREPQSRAKLYIAAGAVAVVLIGLGVFLVVPSEPKPDPAKEAALAVQQRKKAFEEMGAKIKEPAPPPSAPGSPAPEAPRVSTPPAPIRPSPVAAPAVPPTAPKEPAVKPTPAPAPSKGTPIVTALNPDTLARVRNEILTLPAYYEGFLLREPDQTRLHALLSEGKGTPSDAAYLEGLLNGARLKSIREEIVAIPAALATAEKEALDGLPIDRIVLKDSRPLNCRILEEGPDTVRVSRTMSSGVSGQMPMRRENILRIEKGKGIGADFLLKWEAAQKDSLPEQLKVLTWCKENTLTAQARWVAFWILKADPSVAAARLEAGLPSDPVKSVEGGVLTYQGRSWDPKELKEKLLKEGYFLLDGQWYTRKEKTITVPGLFRYEKQIDKPVLIGGNALLCHDTETTYKLVQEPGSTATIEQPEIRNLKRYYAPPMTIELSPRFPPGFVPPVSTFEQDVRVDYDQGAPPQGTLLTGEVPIFVQIGEPVFEASVMTAAEVKAGGSITVHLVTGSGDTEKRSKLYQCDPKESQSHVLPPDLIRGATTISLVAVIEGTAGYTQKIERRHVRNVVKEGKRVIAPALDVIHYRLVPDHKAVLFPSPASGSADVFRLKVVTGEPAASLNKLFAGNPEALK